MKLAILEQHLRGTARDCIIGFPFGERSYELFLKTLEQRFRDEEDQAAFHFRAMYNSPKIRKSDVIGLRKFYDELKAHVQVLESLGPDVSVYLNDPRRMRTVVSKLPSDKIVAWTMHKEA